MKKMLLLAILAIAFTTFAQYRDSGFPTESVYDGIVKTDSHSLFGFLNSDNFQMHHSFEMSYMTFSGQGLAVGSYTNSMLFKFSKKLNFQLETSIINSPYSSLGKNFQNSINGIYIRNASLNFRPSKNVNVVLQYIQIPGGYFNPYSNYGFGYGFSGRSGFLNRYGFDNWNSNQSDDN